MVPFAGRASSFLEFLDFSKTKQRGGGTEQQQQTNQFTKGYNILHRLQVCHLTLTFIIYNKCISTLYLYTYIHKQCIQLVKYKNHRFLPFCYFPLQIERKWSYSYDFYHNYASIQCYHPCKKFVVRWLIFVVILT